MEPRFLRRQTHRSTPRSPRAARGCPGDPRSWRSDGHPPQTPRGRSGDKRAHAVSADPPRPARVGQIGLAKVGQFCVAIDNSLSVTTSLPATRTARPGTLDPGAWQPWPDAGALDECPAQATGHRAYARALACHYDVGRAWLLAPRFGDPSLL